MLKTKFSQYFQCQKWCLVFLIFDHVLIAFYVLQHGWYIQNNSVAALFNMLAARRSCGNICFYQNYRPGKITLQDSVLIIKYLVAVWISSG